MSKNQAVDRSVGLFVTIVGAIAIAYTITVIRQHLHDPSKPSDDQNNDKHQEKKAEEGSAKVASSSSSPRKTPTREHLVVHHGSCHCSRVQFKILGPKVLQAMEFSTKLRFPRIAVLYQDFELLTHPSVLSMYTTQANASPSNSPIYDHYSQYVPGTSHLFLDHSYEPDLHVNNNNIHGIYSFCSYCGMHVIYAPELDPVEIHINIDCLQADVMETRPMMENVPSMVDKRGIGCAPSSLHPLLYNRYQQAQPPHQSSSFLVDPAIDVISEPFSDTTEDMYLRQQQRERESQHDRSSMYYPHTPTSLHRRSHPHSNNSSSSHKNSRTRHAHVPSSSTPLEDEDQSTSSSHSMDSRLELRQGPSKFHSPKRYSHQPEHYAAMHMSHNNNTSHVDQNMDLFQQLYPYMQHNAAAVGGVGSSHHHHSEDYHVTAASKDYDDWYSIPSPMPSPDHHVKTTGRDSRSRSSPRRHSSGSSHSTPKASPLAAAIPKVSTVFRQSDVVDADLVIQLPQFKKHLNRHLKSSEADHSVASSARSVNSSTLSVS